MTVGITLVERDRTLRLCIRLDNISLRVRAPPVPDLAVERAGERHMRLGEVGVERYGRSEQSHRLLMMLRRDLREVPHSPHAAVELLR